MKNFTLYFPKTFLVLFFFTSFFAAAQEGSIDETFDDDGSVYTPFLTGFHQAGATCIAVQNDGRIIVAGNCYVNTDSSDFAIVRYNPGGNIDFGFGTSGKILIDFNQHSDFATDILILPDGKILVAGYTNDYTQTDFAFVRLNEDGSYDNTFGVNGKLTTDFNGFNDECAALLIQPDGKFIAGGYSISSTEEDFVLARYNTDGSPDLTFGINGKTITNFHSESDRINDLALLDDGKIIAAGTVYNFTNSNFGIARYTTNGTLDLTFGVNGKISTDVNADDDVLTGLDIDPDGKIVVTGRTTSGTYVAFATLRYESNGDADLSFSSDGEVITSIGSLDDYACDVYVQPDGKIVVAGNSYVNFGCTIAMIRYTTSGLPDNTFDGDGKVIVPPTGGYQFASAICTQPDGRYLITGSAEFSGFLTHRFHGNSLGTSDNSYLTSGTLIYPNPVNDIFTVEQIGEYSKSSIKIIDLSGRIIYQKENLSGNTFKIDLTNQPAGIYILEVNSGTTFERIKLVKE